MFTQGFNRAPGLAIKAKPLHSLLKAGAEWDWTAECAEAFEHIRACLLERVLPYTVSIIAALGCASATRCIARTPTPLVPRRVPKSSVTSTHVAIWSGRGGADPTVSAACLSLTP